MISNSDLSDQVRSFQRNPYNDYFWLNKPDVKPRVVELISEFKEKRAKLVIPSSTKKKGLANLS